jgi:hypothetical protein
MNIRANDDAASVVVVTSVFYVNQTQESSTLTSDKRERISFKFSVDESIRFSAALISSFPFETAFCCPFGKEGMMSGIQGILCRRKQSFVGDQQFLEQVIVPLERITQDENTSSPFPLRSSERNP